MKSLKVPWILIISFLVFFGVSVLSNFGIIHLSRIFEKEKDSRKSVFLISNIAMALDWDLNLPKGTYAVKLDFDIENISESPQVLNPNEISLFDFYVRCDLQSHLSYYLNL